MFEYLTVNLKINQKHFFWLAEEKGKLFQACVMKAKQPHFYSIISETIGLGRMREEVKMEIYRHFTMKTLEEQFTSMIQPVEPNPSKRDQIFQNIMQEAMEEVMDKNLKTFLKNIQHIITQ